MKKIRDEKKPLVEFMDEFGDVETLMETSLPDPTLLEYYRRLQKREILWNDDIDDTTIDIAMYIKKWNEEEAKMEAEAKKKLDLLVDAFVPILYEDDEQFMKNMREKKHISDTHKRKQDFAVGSGIAMEDTAVQQQGAAAHKHRQQQEHSIGFP